MTPGRGWRITLGVIVLLSALAVGRALDAPAVLRAGLDGIRGLGAWGPGIFIALYVVATMLLVPGTILTLGAGATFGVVTGAVTVSIAATLGATAAFLTGRYLVGETVARWLAAHPALAAIDAAVAREGWKIVGLARLSPALPFSLLNYAFGLTRVSLRDYVVASWAGMLPATVMYVYLGALAGDLATLDTAERSRTPAEWGLFVLGLLASITVTVRVTQLARRALRRRIEEPVSPLAKRR